LIFIFYKTQSISRTEQSSKKPPVKGGF